MTYYMSIGTLKLLNPTHSHSPPTKIELFSNSCTLFIVQVEQNKNANDVE